MNQWHPLFAEILRSWVEDYYEVRTNVPVGDVPREADIVLLRRIGTGANPFTGVWKHLVTWNVLEFKGPSVSPRRDDLDLLVELGLGIHRRLNQEQRKHGQRLIPAAEVSFWYLANRLGPKFLASTGDALGRLEPVVSGVWRSHLLKRPVYLVSRADCLVEPDSVPLHLVAEEDAATKKELGLLLVSNKELYEQFFKWMLTYGGTTTQEVLDMATTKDKGPRPQLKPLIDFFGLEEILQQAGLKEVLSEAGVKRIVDALGAKKVIDELGARKVIDELGTRKVLDELGAKKVLDELGARKVLDELGWERLVKEGSIDSLIDSLSPTQLRELKKRLK